MRRTALVVTACALALTGCGGGTVVGTASPAAESSATDDECIGYGCSPEQDAELDERESEANAEESAAASPSFSAVGETVAFDGGITAGTITLNGLRRITEPETQYSQDSATHGSWLVADVTVQVVERREPGALLVSYFDFTVQDTNGLVYPSTSSPLDSALSTEVTAGRMVRGEVAFDAPEGILLLDWTPGFDGPSATWQING